MDEKILKKKITPEQYAVLREKGTEKAFTGKLLNNKKRGVYECAFCGNPLFKSETKFESGTGWPSFDNVFEENVNLEKDLSGGIERIEVTCKKCGSHLGHLFYDGPTKTRKRYCINSLSLDFKGESKK